MHYQPSESPADNASHDERALATRTRADAIAGLGTADHVRRAIRQLRAPPARPLLTRSLQTIWPEQKGALAFELRPGMDDLRGRSLAAGRVLGLS